MPVIKISELPSIVDIDKVGDCIPIVDVSTGTTSKVSPSELAKKIFASPTFTGSVLLPATTSLGILTPEELQYLSNVTSPIQDQLNNKIETDGLELGRY